MGANRGKGRAEIDSYDAHEPTKGLAPWMRDRSLLPRVPVDRLVRDARRAQ